VLTLIVASRVNASTNVTIQVSSDHTEMNALENALL